MWQPLIPGTGEPCKCFVKFPRSLTKARWTSGQWAWKLPSLLMRSLSRYSAAPPSGGVVQFSMLFISRCSTVKAGKSHFYRLHLPLWRTLILPSCPLQTFIQKTVTILIDFFCSNRTWLLVLTVDQKKDDHLRTSRTPTEMRLFVKHLPNHMSSQNVDDLSRGNVCLFFSFNCSRDSQCGI